MSEQDVHYPFPDPESQIQMEEKHPLIRTVVRRSQKIGELVAALAKAQLEYTSIVKDQKNPYYGSWYADLSSVIDATRPALAKNGLVILQQSSVDVEAQRVTVTSTLAHSSDQWVENELVLPAVMLGKDGKPRFDAQSCGAAQTYGRRYSWQGLAGVAAEQDDDANKASGIGTKEAAQGVATEKLARSSFVPQLFYIWNDELQTAEITGAESLKATNKDLLDKFWNAKAGAPVVNAEQLDGLRYELERRGVPFSRLGPPPLTEQLKASVEKVAKSKKV